jgi:phage shock protein A
MTAFIKAIINFFRGLLGMATKKLEDPVRDGKFAIEDSKKQISEFRTKIAALIAEKIKMEKRRGDAKSNFEKWNKILENATEKNDESAIAKSKDIRNRYGREFKALDTDLERTMKTISDLKTRLEMAQNKVNNAQSNITILSARKDAADIKKNLASAAAGLDGGALSSLDNLERSVLESEAEADAIEELSADSSGDTDLESKYGGSGGDDEFDDLAAKFKNQ